MIQLELTKEQALLLSAILGDHIRTKSQERLVRKEETGEVLSFTPAEDPVGDKNVKDLQAVLLTALEKTRYGYCEPLRKKVRK